MKNIPKTVWLSGIFMLVFAMLMTPAFLFFAVSDEKTDENDIIADADKISNENNESLFDLTDIDKDLIYTGQWDSGYRDWLCSAPDEVLKSATPELLEYFLDSNFFGQQILSVAPDNYVKKVDFTINEAFKELVSRDDLLQTLENYAKDCTNESELKKILEQDSVKSVFLNTPGSSLDCPNLAKIYSDISF